MALWMGPRYGTIFAAAIIKKWAQPFIVDSEPTAVFVTRKISELWKGIGCSRLVPVTFSGEAQID